MTQLIGAKAPSFSATAVVNKKHIHNFSLEDLQGSYVVLFFYPLDFTFVCPTELHAFEEKHDDFQQRNTHVVGCSVDSAHSHSAWLSTPKSQGGIEGVSYPIIADLTKSIARDYGVLKEDEGIAYRGLFLIDTKGIVRHLLINDLPLGRSVDEALRMVDALQFHEKNGEVCPANWNAGKSAMKPSKNGVLTYFS